MKQVLIQQGRAVVEDVPAPQVEPGTILVSVEHSCISIGTEMAGVKSSGTPLWKRALEKPEKVKKGLEMMVTQGFIRTAALIQSEVSAGTATGYSASGYVIEVGDGIKDIVIGDRVACAGAQYAHHAEIIRVPRNLAVKVPEKLDLAAASTVTLGAIGLQGVRRSHPTLGETFVVIGLGVLGQLTVQILRANGCRVVGVDLSIERIDLAQKMGMEAGICPDTVNEVDQVYRVTNGVGADGVIITAATPYHQVASSAFRMCRKKGRVILVGDVGLNLNRSDFYQKEIDFLVSTSYGPGRYDPDYEERGIDYPIGYVRWTENRNMAAYLHLLSEKKVDVAPLISRVYPVEQAPEAYEEIMGGDRNLVMVLLQYPHAQRLAIPEKKMANPETRPIKKEVIRVALVGAGAFAKSVHLPNLRSFSDTFHIRTIVSRTGHNAASIARQYKADYSTTDYQSVIEDPDVDAVVIATRHQLHASMTLQALEAGKHVLVEKPLALNKLELEKIVKFFQDRSQAPILLTGFNRRFSPFATRLHEMTQNHANPMILNYRMNAGYIPLENWVHNIEGGGRNIGEACHIYDLFTYLTGAKAISMVARAITPRTKHYSGRDNFMVIISFDDGSLANLTYTALGSQEYPKEHLEIYSDGKVAVLDDYSSLTIYGGKGGDLRARHKDKGHKQELEAFARGIKAASWPIDLWQQKQAMEIAFQVEEQLSGELFQAGVPCAES